MGGVVMALWNSSADTIKCPSCAANLIFEIKIGKLVCRSCGNVYAPNSLDNMGRLDSRDSEAAGDREASQHEIICNSCGAVVITDENTSASFCSFCGSPALSTRRLSNQFRPDYIIPFKIEREEAEKIFLEWAGKNKYVPRKFTSRENVKKLRGIYVPFWLLDSTVNCTLEGTGYLTTETNPSSMMFAVDRTIEFKLKKVPFDGAKKISNRLMRSIEPYDYKDLEPFSPNYIPGYYAQRYDMRALDMIDYISGRFNKYGAELGKLYESSMGERYTKFDITSVTAEAGDFKQSYALLPIWFLRYKYKDINYDFAINGQTGEPGGDLPYSSFKRGLRVAAAYVAAYGLYFLIIAAALFFSVLFLASLTQAEYDMKISRNTSAIMMVLLYAGLGLGRKWLAGVSASLKTKLMNVKNNTLNMVEEAPEALTYYDAEAGITLKNKQDKFVSTVPKEDFISREEKLERSMRRIGRRPFI